MTSSRRTVQHRSSNIIQVNSAPLCTPVSSVWSTRQNFAGPVEIVVARKILPRGIFIMLEPLIVLTVLNCFFMFSSTVTTCALWWQYRSHRCCFKKDPASQAAREAFSKLKSTYVSKTSKKPGVSRNEPGRGSPKQTEKSISRSKSNSAVNHEAKSKRTSKQKAKSDPKHLSQNKSPSEERIPSTETIGNWDLEDKTRMSEASQTVNDGKSAVVMEYSTVQKIVQILDDDTDLNATKLAIKELNAKQNGEEKKSDFDSGKSEAIPAYTPQT
ncbi:uncharacterized protein LOC128875820 isoform X1 [Hylaeus volcanicus]|uniref:uncharacterized protein LOC128875820 isoform X1 n=2 Tax=Hylaeus volcanicus TaxID=313075 RepID=UPI0023B849F2|nr:uncharacterized protein LOC128875820 isoform X1 [Hylaeus volcanicus]XP_053977702.1 uncharacterized protein LOC128875820 isoform X1 [Hylaeus volcanicus]